MADDISPIRFYDDMKGNITKMNQHVPTKLVPRFIQSVLVDGPVIAEGEKYVEAVQESFQPLPGSPLDALIRQLNSKYVATFRAKSGLTWDHLSDLHIWGSRLAQLHTHGRLNGRLFLDFDYVINRLEGVAWPSSEETFQEMGNGEGHIMFAVGDITRLYSLRFLIHFLETNGIEVYILTNNLSCINEIQKSYFERMIQKLHPVLTKSRLLCGNEESNNKLNRLYALYIRDLTESSRRVNDINGVPCVVFRKYLFRQNDGIYTLKEMKEIETGSFVTEIKTFECLKHALVYAINDGERDWFEVQKDVETYYACLGLTKTNAHEYYLEMVKQCLFIKEKVEVDEVGKITFAFYKDVMALMREIYFDVRLNQVSDSREA